MRHTVDDLGGLVDLEQTEVAATGDGEQDAPGTFDGGLEQRGGDGGTGGAERTTLAGAVADAHEGRTGIAHDHLDVGEVGVDETRRGDEVGDALHALEQDLVGHLERVEHGGLVVRHREQSVVRDDDEGVDLLLEGLDAGLGLGGAALALEGERPGDHTDGERTEALGDLGDDRGCTGAGAATLAGGDEDHVGALEGLLDLLAVRLGGRLADLGIGTGAETTGDLAADVELDIGIAHEERLRVGVDGDELDALQAGVDHPVDGVDATATDADDLDHREVVLRTASHGGSPSEWSVRN